MAFQLFIKNNLKDEDYFSSGKRYDFIEETVTIGSSEQATCQIDDSEIAKIQFTIQPQQQGFNITIMPGALVFINDKAMTPQVTYPLQTGDKIRIRHWICLFHKVQPHVNFSPQALLLSRIVKITVLFLIVSEFLLILSGSAWVNIIHKRSSLLTQAQRLHYLSQQLDSINAELKTLNSRTDFTPIEAAVSRSISNEFLKIRSYIFKNEEKISNENLLQIQRITMDYQTYINKLKERTLITPIEELKLEEKLKKVLKFPPKQ